MSNVAKKIIAYTLTVICLILLIIYFIVIPTVRDIKKISSDVYAERLDLEKKYLRGQLLKKTVEDFEKIKPQKNKLLSAFITENQELEFITNLEKIATENKLTQNIRLHQNPDDQGDKIFYNLPLEVTAQGDFINIMKYLRDLETLSYYFNINSISLDSDGQTPLSVSVNLKGSVYVLIGSVE